MPADPDTCPATHPAHSFSLAEVLRIIGTALVAGAAIGYLIAEYDGETLTNLARIFASVAMVTTLLMIFEARRRHRIDHLERQQEVILARLESRLHEAEFAEGYVQGIQRRPPEDGSAWHLRSV